MLAPLLAREMSLNWSQLAADCELDGVVPVPLHPLKEFRRGYNQARLLADEVSSSLGVPLRELLRRRYCARSQAQLDFVHRQANAKNTFQTVPGIDANGLDLLVVDDVFTTGATLTEATETLLAAGADSVCVLTLARG